MGDCANPTGLSAWTPLTFANRGLPTEAIVTGNDAPTAFEVHGNVTDAATGLTGIPSWTWTDWTPLSSVDRVDHHGAPRVIMIRVLLPKGSTHTRPNGGFLEYHLHPEMNQGFDYVAGHVPADVVTFPQPIQAEAACLGRTNSPVSCVQFLTRKQGIVGMAVGDSHHQGTSTTTQFWNYLFRATIAMAAGHLGHVPFGYWSVAQGGADSRWFFPSLANLLPVAKPSFVVLPGWTYNEMSGNLHADRGANEAFFARLMMAAENCSEHGATPIFLTPFPRDRGGMTSLQVEPWLNLRNNILALREAGAIVVDATPMLGHTSGGQLDGTYLPEFSDDHAHPNDAGHAVIATKLIPVIERLCRLPPI